ncbi:hypothetical protein RchiOBHm_Chr6g0258511 [Rosa chinensis]|uniref:Apple domain-containing protein n=1 Tax=Rosa chinensis TaxID=74649 RepID=A0A2P6PML5_ROSCH|nr:uncharacterized protein LOC112173184 [Rosa chinensis]XP_040365188.1 uncharacterized protein LOC112173184 [Rosa chinensis]XP_040365189.1 uncharacterized protein LOC112173184 [Rosa chinensis]PRQ23178.1 hypothetical protein RchiOBHm_Chr6g0258511 [Rosa chinensis]
MMWMLKSVIATNYLTAVEYTPDHIRKIEESVRIRKLAEPVELIRLVKQFKKELSAERSLGFELPESLKLKPTNEIIDELKNLPLKANVSEQRDEVLPGRPLPPEWHAELHTDYDGAAVRWGLNHHKESAADCCQACLVQAKRAKPNEKKCNVWVYCPAEDGCHSPDIYEHRLGKCWLKTELKVVDFH